MTALTLQADLEAGKQTAHIVEVTAEMAALWLDRNRKNRRLRQAVVDLYATDMRDGNWQMTGEAIKFSATGDILDGQHRLWAIVTTGIPIRLMVITGLAEEAQSVMDSGVKRTAADSLNLAGLRNSNTVAAAARLGIAYEAGKFTSPSATEVPGVTHAQVKNWVDLNPGVVDAASTIAGGYFGRSRAAGTFALYRLQRIDHEQAGEFFDDLVNLRMGGKGDPRATLHHRLSTSRHQNERMSAVKEVHLIFRTWNAVRSGESLKQLKVLDHTVFAEPR